MPDYYTVLRISHTASRKEIEQARARLIKESQYDTTIDRAAVEHAYRVLSDIASKAQYDSRQAIFQRRLQGRPFKRPRGEGGFSLQRIVDWLTLPHLLYILGISIVFLLVFYWFRFGYVLKDFMPGDILYDRVTNARYGRILRIDENHQFGNRTDKAYQIELDKRQIMVGVKERTVWLSQDTVKARCFKP